ncbi:hypothetical protein EFN64_08280 [Leuconostoc citreum]|nr:hypothetical protein [Leuconostoc citreum]MCT3062951.1 hypothetical protein [Leuconostoc citreum]MCT3073733.1 hypothetical protein [Leuconostoc citreum]HCM89203.1 hypothetical protein [Vagococcus sp.]
MNINIIVIHPVVENNLVFLRIKLTITVFTFLYKALLDCGDTFFWKRWACVFKSYAYLKNQPRI